MTRDLVDAGIQKKFASFEVLMSTARGHWAYRFALENTEQGDHPRIPFLPLHRRDLIVAESAGKTFVPDHTRPSESRSFAGGSAGSSKSGSTNSSATIVPSAMNQPRDTRKINWSKFAVMGDTLSILRKAQSCPYTGFAPNEAVKTAFLDVRLCKDDDVLWARSIALEAVGTTSGPEGQRAQVKRRIQDGFDKLKGHTRDA